MRSNTLASQLEQLHIKPSDIRFIGLTNSHIDHIGNLEMFPKVMVLMQNSEWDFAETLRGRARRATVQAQSPRDKGRRRLRRVRRRVCAVERRRFPVGVRPTRQLLQPEATGAAMEVTK